MIRHPSSWSRLAPVALACVHLGCIANRPVLTCPKQGGPAWVEIKSRHFMLETDLPEEDGRKMITELETSRAALISLLGAPPDDAAVPTEVVVFEREVDFVTTTTEPGAGGLFFGKLSGDIEKLPVIASHGGLSEDMRSTLQHEMVHQLVRRRTGRLPFWLDEGLAETFSTLQVDGDELIVGEPAGGHFWRYHFDTWGREPRNTKRWMTVDSAPSLDELLTAKAASVYFQPHMRAYYAAASKLVHVLRGDLDPGMAPRFASMMSSLMTGTDGDEAFTRAYRDVPRQALADAYQAYLLDHHEYLTRIHFRAPPAPRIASRTFSDGEVHALWARLGTYNELRAVDAELDRGLAENPDDPALLFVRASNHLLSKDKPVPTADIEALRRMSPYDPRYVLLDLGSKLRPAAEKGAGSLDPDLRLEVLALLGLLQRVATSPTQRALSVLVLVGTGRTEEARALAESVVKENPTCEVCWGTYAEALLASDRPAEARDAAERGLSLLPDNDPGTPYKELIARAEAALEKTRNLPAPR